MALFLQTHSRAQWMSLDGGVNGFVRAFSLDQENDRLLIGGSFPFVQNGAVRANNLAWWDGSAWSVEGLVNGNGDTTQYGLLSPVLSLAIRSDTIFASHLNSFWHYDYDLGFATMLLNGEWLPCGSPNGIFYFLSEEGRMFSGGVHDSLYGEYAPGIHEWRNGSFQPISGMPFSSRVAIYDVEFWQDQFYFGGTFETLGTSNMITYDGDSQWSPVGVGVGGWFIETICGFGDSLYVGGWFPNGPNVQSAHIQLWDGVNWKSFFPDVEFIDPVREIQVHNGVLYICGVHHWIDDNVNYGLLSFDGSTLCSIGGPREGGASKFAIYQNALHLASNFISGFETEFIARLPLEGLIPDRCSDVTNAIHSDNEMRSVFRVFPNPVDHMINIEVDPEMIGSEILVADQLGRHVLAKSRITSTKMELQGNGLAPGIYTVRVVGNDLRYNAQFVKE